MYSRVATRLVLVLKTHMLYRKYIHIYVYGVDDDNDEQITLDSSNVVFASSEL